MGRSMNSDTQDTALECAREAGAIQKCSKCGGHDVAVNDDTLVKRAYKAAEKRRKDGDRGFRNLDPDEVRMAVDDVLQDAPDRCPRFPR
jgi:hypothetical protein